MESIVPSTDALVKLLGGVVTAGVAYIIRLGRRLDVLEAVFQRSDNELHKVSMEQAEHDKRLAVIDSILDELRKLAPDLRNVVVLTAKMDVLLEKADRRLEYLEQNQCQHH
jgi:hypothetical protein